MLKKHQKPKNRIIEFNGTFFLYNMNSKAMSTEKYSFTTFTVGACLFGAFGASRLLILTLDFMAPAHI